MTEKEKTEKEPLKFRNRFRIQVKRYWKYTKKWFTLALLIGGISGILMALFTSLVVNMQSWLSKVPIYVKYPLVGGITFRDIEARYESEFTRIHSKRLLTIEELESDEGDLDDF